MPGPGFWQIKMDEVLKQCTAFTVGNLGFFGCDCMPFGLSNAPATFQRLVQNCLWELNLIYCLIYLDDIIIFSQMAEEHLYRLHFIFDQFREHNLKWNPSKCDFYRNEITYLAHQVSKDVLPRNSNLKAITECTHWKSAPKYEVLLAWWATTGGSLKGSHALHNPLVSISLERGLVRSQRRVSLTKDAMKDFEALKQACMTAPILVFTDYTKQFLLEADASKDGLGAVLSQKQADR